MSGLVLVTLPIGNNGDLTFRAKEALEKYNYIVAEDTRVLKEFLKFNGINFETKKIESFHDHADNAKLDKIISVIEKQWVVFVSDAGSPVISDPAFPLIKEVLDKGYKLETMPGVSAVTTALELSGHWPKWNTYHLPN